MLFLNRQGLLYRFSQISFFRKGFQAINPQIAPILKLANISQSVYSQNLQLLRDVDSQGKVNLFVKEVLSKVDADKLPLVLMDTLSHTNNLVVSREYYKVIIDHMSKLSTPKEMFLGLKVLGVLTRFEFKDRIELTHQVQVLSNKLFHRIATVIDEMKDDLSTLCEFVEFSVKYGYFSKKVIGYIEEAVKNRPNQDYLVEKYFINFLKSYAKYPTQIISKFKAIESIVIQPITSKIINEAIGSSIEQKVEIVATIAKLGFQTRGHFFRTPSCFTILREINVGQLKLSSVIHLFEIISHIPKSYLKIKDQVVNQFIQLTYNQSAQKIIKGLKHVDIEKLEDTNLVPIYPHLMAGMNKGGLTFETLNEICSYFQYTRSKIPEQFCQAIYECTQRLCKKNSILTVSQVSPCLKFIMKHSLIDIHDIISYVVENVDSSVQSNNRLAIGLVDMLFVIERFYSFNNIPNPYIQYCQKITDILTKFILSANAEFLLTIDQSFLFVPYVYIEQIQKALVERIVYNWPNFQNHTKCNIVLFYSALTINLRRVVYKLFDEERSTHKEFNHQIYQIFINLPNYKYPNLRKHYLASQKVLEIMTEESDISNNKIIRFIFSLPKKVLVLKSGILSKSFLNLIDRINLQDFKNVNINWLTESILKLSQFVEMHDNKLMKLFCNYVLSKEKMRPAEQLKLFSKYFSIVGKHRDSPNYIHFTEKTIVKLQQMLNNCLQDRYANPIPSILQIFYAIGILPEPFILQKCRNLLRQNYSPLKGTDFNKWELLMLHLNSVVEFDSLFLEQLFYDVEQIVSDKKMNLLSFVKCVELLDVSTMREYPPEVSHLFSNFALEVIQDQHNVSIKILLKLYKVAHFLKSEQFKATVTGIIVKRRLDDNDIMHILEALESVDDNNEAILQKVITTCTENMDTLYPKIKVMVANVLVRMTYNTSFQIREFLDTLILSIQESLEEIQHLTVSNINQRIGYRLQLLWVMLMTGKKQGPLFQILRKMFLSETIASLEEEIDNSTRWRILEIYYLLDINELVPHNFKSKFLSMKKSWMISFKANIPKDIKPLLSKEKGWKLYPQVSGFKIIAYHPQNNLAVVNMSHRMYRPLTESETGYSKCRDMIVEHYYNNPKIIKIDFSRYKIEKVRNLLK